MKYQQGARAENSYEIHITSAKNINDKLEKENRLFLFSLIFHVKAWLGRRFMKNLKMLVLQLQKARSVAI
jgi:hypothetical protein